MTDQRGTPSRRTPLPENATQLCASCLVPLPPARQRRAWAPITREGSVVGYTCPDCPLPGEPITREPSGRFLARPTVTESATEAKRAGRPAVPRRTAKQRFNSLDDARTWVASVRASVVAHGEWREAEPTAGETIKSLTDRWLASRVDIRKVTRDGYTANLAPVVRRVGQTEVAAFSASDARDLVAWLSSSGSRKGGALSATSVRACLKPLSQALDMAVTDGLVERNVTKGVKRPRADEEQQGRRKVQHWAATTLQRFADEIADKDDHGALWRLSACGLTRSEIMGLLWEEIDLDAGTVNVVQARVLLADGTTVIDKPKSQQRYRTINVEAILPGTVAALRALKARQSSDRMRAGTSYDGGSGLVALDSLGTPMVPRTYSDRFRSLCREYGLPLIRLHSLRHSLAFMLIDNGVSPNDAASFLGHTVEVFISTYLPSSGSAGVAASVTALSGAFGRLRTKAA